MTRTTFIAAALALAAVVPAQAQVVPRTFVSAAGNDSNNCANVTTPCRHFATAYAATAPNGEIFVLDPANYGSLTITHGVRIEGHGWASIAPPSGANTAAITINASTGDSISIHGVSIDGTGATGGTNGIVFNSGGGLEITDCVIRNFTQTGAYIDPNSSMNLLISNTLVLDNPTAGINITLPQNGSVYVSIDHVTVNSNGNGIFMSNPLAGSGIFGTITNSVINSNVNTGISLSGGGGATFLSIKDSSVSNTLSGTGISVSGTIAFLSRLLVINNGTGIALSHEAEVFSAGDNDIANNITPISGGSLTPNPKQ